MDHGTARDEMRSAVIASGGPADADPGDLDCTSIFDDARAGATAGVWRFSSGDWSVVLKVLHEGGGGHPSWQPGGDEDHWFYWRREALAYSSKLVSNFAGPLRAPRCFGVFDRRNGSIGIWLEDLRHNTPASRWSVDEYRAAAFALGMAQGDLASPAELPTDPWLARSWLRGYVMRRAHLMESLGDVDTWAHRLIAGHLDKALLHRVRDIWDDRDRLLDRIESAPQTICHLDLHPANLFRAGGDVVLIDWAFIGIGAIGEDAGNLIPDAILDFHVAPDRFNELAVSIVSGYLDGLGASGWRGDVDDVMRVIRATAAIKYCWIVPAMFEAVCEGRPTLNGRAIDEALPWWAEVVARLVSFARDA